MDAPNKIRTRSRNNKNRKPHLLGDSWIFALFSCSAVMTFVSILILLASAFIKGGASGFSVSEPNTPPSVAKLDYLSWSFAFTGTLFLVVFSVVHTCIFAKFSVGTTSSAGKARGSKLHVVAPTTAASPESLSSKDIINWSKKPASSASPASPTSPTSTKRLPRVRTARCPPSALEADLEKKKNMYMKQSLDIVVLGASGDLAKKKTYPSLYELYVFGFLPPQTTIWGFARSEYEINAFYDRIRPFLQKSKQADPDKIENFLQLCRYHRGIGYDDVGSWEQLACKLDEREGMTATNRMFYFAIPNTAFGASGRAISNASGMMVDEMTGYWNRMIIEKPFGRDSESSEKLATELTSLFAEHQLYRIDHYLGKDMVQNILSVRLSNVFFSSVWNKEHVESVSISWAEDIGTQGRGGYFDQSGIIRDVMQNHLLQLLSIVAMEPPTEMTASAVRDAKTKVLTCIPPLTINDMILGQYTRGFINGVVEPGYVEDETVPNNSIAPTYCLAQFEIHNKRWEGVPFIIKAGKAMGKKHCTVRLQFKQNGEEGPRNELVLRIQPNPAIWMKVNVQEPGLKNRLMQTEMDLTYNKHEGMRGEINAYTRLLLDVLRGDQSTFVRSDELKEAWRIFTPVLHEIDSESIRPILYEAGGRGPSEADERMSKIYKRSAEYVWKESE